ncbi:MAG TPA: formylmethanofuran dehydrogenase subunit B [Pirellulales bacterium]|nr:formylmethanofuran dehydrogenase subunit B [Pirellulales bacterium]
MDPYKSSVANVTRDVVCTACGCLCDDIVAHVRDGRVVAAEKACDRGKAWFLAPRDAPRPEATVDGRSATLDEAVDRAASLLAEARNVLVYGLSETTIEAQRTAIALADRLGATIDTPTSATLGPIGMALQGVGEMTCTLGEMRNRADLIVFWGCDPAVSHPRHFERYSLDAPGMFLPRGRADRFCIVVDIERTATAARADMFVQVRAGCDFESLWTLRALMQGQALDGETVRAQTGVELGAWKVLGQRMREANFGAMVYGSGLAQTRGGAMNVEALLALVRDMNAHTRFVANALRGPGNQVGADNVLLWQTGFPMAVNLSRGFPRYGPGEFGASELLQRREVDAVLIVASDPLVELPESADALRLVPTVCIDSRDTATARAATVSIATALYGIESPGTVYRMDDVPLALRPILPPSHPSDDEVLKAIASRIESSVA